MRFNHPFTPTEKRLIRHLKTPAQVQKFIISHFRYNKESRGETLRSFRQSLKHQSAHCLEAVFIAATILGEHGYPPTVLDITSKDHLDHVLFLYKKNGRYGTIGFSRCTGLYGRPARYRSLYHLVMSYYTPFIDKTGRITGYGTASLDDIPRTDWRFAKGNIWAVQNYLIKLRHKRIHTSTAHFKRLRAKYLASLPEQK
ncbi:MAG: hypothetical protein COV45_01600 [Deltaproteobacteria bacterium CG11_big_fil_rev_8_21_14_0_20_47_16]|nr:MAG: hypothetical protein COV45_01600 [Deltaproteobacteria bacterium CG11_big_fil_rev_8_21_14_0_20_47_16]